MTGRWVIGVALLGACSDDPVSTSGTVTDTDPLTTPPPSPPPGTTTTPPPPSGTTDPPAESPAQGCVIERRGTGDLAIWSQIEVRNVVGSILYLDYDDFNDGTIEWSEASTYDETGLLRTSYAMDTNGDVFPDRIETTVWVDGLAVGGTVDEDADGTIESAWSGVVEGGLVTLIQRDDGPDGSVDAITVLTYDASDRLVSTSFDEGPNGVPDETSATTYVGAGQDHTTEVDVGADGDVDRTTTEAFDAAGRRLLLTVTDAAGTTTTTWTWHGTSTDPETVTIDADLFPDTVIHTDQVWSFDVFTDRVNRVDTETSYSGVPGTFQSTENWSWACPP